MLNFVIREILLKLCVTREFVRENGLMTPPPPFETLHREFFIQRISRFFCCHLVEIEDIITPPKIGL